VNRVRDYQALEREYITGTMSLRELCRRHGVTAHSAVVVQARREGWAEKREKFRTRASAKYIELRADRAALREAEVRDHAIDAIDEAITRFRADLQATEKKLIDGEWVEVPVVRMTPRDLVLLIDRLQVLFGRPGTISEERRLTATITTESLPVDLLQKIIEATRGLADTRAPEASPLPRLPSRPEN
jgi:transposase-like protein